MSLRSGGEDTSKELSVSEALKKQDGSRETVTGYVIGQPISDSTIVKTDYPSDYAIAIADSPDETEMNKILLVQVPSGFRPAFGLRSNPSLLGQKLSISGTLTNYFSQPGLKAPDDFALANDSDPIEEPEHPDPPQLEDYYRQAEGKTGQELKRTLHDIIDDHHELTYSAVWEALRNTDEDPSDSTRVILFYTGRSQSKTHNGGKVDDWNREHVWAKSHGDFGTSQGPGTDLHHLRPTDVTVNSSRSNLDFDNGGSPHPEAPLTFYDKDSWEPKDTIKGDVARMLFYMDVRYEGDSGELDLELNNEVENNKKPLHGKLSVLLEWHQEDPVDSFEMRRNQLIFERYQGNRNPFIDHPEWVDAIW
ncbi:endonuclease [Bacillus sp. Marseille-Q1617]|uniref:endonuclease n=1 Tax=Bacillus sp. Marseille-Q1617 TaxID=2736887 RepID=UPI0020CA2836|nr:endonuclease [Bacillus sp. Marseille-Q1617]